MYFSPKTIIAVAGLLATASAAPAGDASHAQHERHDVSLASRGLFDWWYTASSNVQLCYKPNYGAVGKPWEGGSKPGSFCGKNKPRNDGQWKNIIIWDGGDSVRCSNWLSRWGINICTGGNFRSPLPWNCRPPKKNKPPKTPKTTTATVTATVTKTDVTTETVTTTATTTLTADTPAPTDDDPYKDPVCQSNYQQQFNDFKPPAGTGPAEHPAVGAAVVDNENYIHYTLATNPADCLAVCDQTEGCVFVNSYIDYNPQRQDDPKHQAGVYTCTYYRACPGLDKNTNYGGQGDGAVILDSDGWCKSGACGGR